MENAHVAQVLHRLCGADCNKTRQSEHWPWCCSPGSTGDEL